MAPSHNYAWSEGIQVSKSASSAGTKKISSHSSHRSNSQHRELGRKFIVLIIRLCIVTILTVVMFVLGVLEAKVLEERSKALLQATHDDNCRLFIFPYDDHGDKIAFFRSGRQNFFVGTGNDTRASFDIDFASQQRLKSQDCDLIIDPLSDGNIQFYHFGSDNQTDRKAVEFDVCREPEGGEPAIFRVVEGSGLTGLAAWALIIWISLRILQIARDVSCISYDARYPPTTKDGLKGCCVPWPLSRLLRKFTGGNRLVLPNIWRTALRPFIMYGTLLAIVFKPFTAVSLNTACPQLIMLSGELGVTVSAICLGTLVVLVGVMDWSIDIYRWKDNWGNRFDEDNGCEHANAWQGSVASFLCGFIVLLAIVKFFWRLSWSFLVELRWIFTIQWPKYEVSRWSHVLRILALLLLMVDTIAFLLKFAAKGAIMDESLKLKASGYTLEEMRDKGITATEVGKLGYSTDEIKAAGYTAADMKAAGYKATTLKKAGYTASELGAADYEAQVMKDAGFTCFEMKVAGFTTLEMNEVDFSHKEMKAAGYTALEMKALKLLTQQMKGLGFTGKEMKDAGYEAQDLRKVGYTALEMHDGGFACEDMKAAGYSGLEMKVGGYTASEMKAAKYASADMISFGYTAAEMRGAEYACWGIREAGYKAADVYAAGYTPSEMRAAGYTAIDMKPILRKPQKMKAIGYTASDMKAAGYDASELKLYYTASQMNAGGYDAHDMRAAGYKVQEMKFAAYTAADMSAAGCTPSEMKAAGYTASELKAAGFKPADMKAAGYTVSEIQLLGYTPSEMKAAGYTTADMKAAGYTTLDMRAPRLSPTGRQ